MAEYIDGTPTTETPSAPYAAKIPSYEDAADIKDALKLYHYGTSIVPTTESGIDPKSVAGYLRDLRTDVTTLENLGAGSGYALTQPLTPEDGYIWLSDTPASGESVSASAVYSAVEPSHKSGLIWIDLNQTPFLAKVSDGTVWYPLTEIPNIIDAAGDIIYGDSIDSISRLPIGTTDQVLTVSSGLPSWKTPKAWVLKSSGSLSGSSLNISELDGEKLVIALHNWSHDDITDSSMLSVTFNNNTGPNYINTVGVSAASALHSPVFDDATVHDITFSVDLANTSAILKPVATIADTSGGQYFGYFRYNSPITSIQVFLSAGNFDSGTYEVWSYE